MASRNHHFHRVHLGGVLQLVRQFHDRNSRFFLLSTCLALILYTASLNCSETVVLNQKNIGKVKIRFDFPSGADSSDSPPAASDWNDNVPTFKFDENIVSFIVDDKLKQLQRYLAKEKFANSSVGVNNQVSIESYSTLLEKAYFALNVSLDNIRLTGISTFGVSDMQTVKKTKKVSALLRFPNAVQISMFYKATGVRYEESTHSNKTYTDKGKIVFTVHGWRSVFSGKVADIVNGTRLDMMGFGMRSHYDFFESTIESFMQGDEKIDLSRHISSELMKKAINAFDDKFETTLLDKMNIREVSSFSSLREGLEHFERDHLMAMESSKFGSFIKKRTKRQVPCQVGEELDEYVDSLFRFLKRLIRVMEPFGLPNATIELEEYNLQIFLHSGGATRAYTFERRKPAWVLCRNETTTLGLTVGVEDLRVHYKYRVIQDWRLLFDGDLEAQIRRPKAQVQISQLNPPPEKEDDEAADLEEEEEEQQVQQRIDKLKVWSPGQITVIIRGLGNLSAAVSMIVNQMLADTSQIEPVLAMLETDGVVAANEMLKNVSIPIFSII